MLKRTLTIALAAAALGTAACGGEDERGGSTAARAPAGGAATAVAIGDNTFSPATTKVSVGETVKFENGGAIPHTVTGEGFDSGSLASGESFEFAAEQAGTVKYVCVFHPGMQGTIEVS
jgi:plastocyanin